MSKRYEKQGPGSVFVDMLETVRDTYHARLAEVMIDVLTVCEYDEESGEELPCLKLHGYPCAATIKVMSHEGRAQGSGDALLTIDAIAWHGLSTPERIALLDHELTHIQIVEKDGAIARDDLRRPKLKLRLHDVEIGGFREVMARHQEAALEVVAIRRCQENGQYWWDFSDGAGARVSAADAALSRFASAVTKGGTTVSIETGGRRVTLTPEDGERLRAATVRNREGLRP